MSSGCKLLSLCLAALIVSGPFPLFSGAGEHMPQSSGAPAEESGKGASIRVLWTVSSYIITGNASLREDEARAMLFKPLDIGASTITFAGETCREVVFTNETADAERYLRERFQITPQSLGLDEGTVKVVRTTCRIPGFNEYVRLPDRRLLVPMHGVVFIFSPAVNY